MRKGYSYEVPGFGRSGFLQRVTKGYTLAGTTILQQGGRYSVYTTAAFQPTFDAAGTINGLQASSGDFNGDGYNYDLPNITNASLKYNRSQYVSGVFPKCGGTAFGTANTPCGQFSLPAPGAEGNEAPNGFRNPGYADWDLDVKKTTRINERFNLEVRVNLFNLFNWVNLQGVDGNANDGTFGQSTMQYSPRDVDLGARVNF